MDAMGNPKMPLSFQDRIFLVVGILINAKKSQETWHWGRHVQRWMGNRGHQMTPTETMAISRENPSILPYICSVSFPQCGDTGEIQVLENNPASVLMYSQFS